MMRTLLASFAVAVPFVCAGLQAAEPVEVATGQKLDSDLGSLPHYAEWHRHSHLSHLVPPQVANAPGEKLDSGLGALPPYAQWDQYPELRHMAASANPRTAVTGVDEQRDRFAVIRR